MSDNVRSSNLAFLSQRFPQLASRIENHEISPGTLRPIVHHIANGVSTASVDVGGREKYLHSKYDPVQEAHRWAASQTPPPGSVVMIFGWGLGYHALKWIEAHGANVEAVIVFEPEPELFKTSLFCVNLNPLAKAKRLEFIIGCDDSAFDLAIQKLIEPLLSRDLSLLPLPFADIYPQEATAFLKSNFQKLMQRREVILRFMTEAGDRCQEQIVRNVPAMAESFFPRDVKGILAGQPAVIVAAGPSLDRNIDRLQGIQNRAWTFAVDTSLRVLKQHGVEPHFVVIKDPTERNSSHFEGLQDLQRPALIFDSQIAPDLPPRFHGPKICTPNRNFALHRFIDGLQLTREDPLPHSTNVALAAFNIAVVMGCDPIVFVGLDFCFAKDGGPSHAAQTALRSTTQYDAKRRTMVYQLGEHSEELQVLEVEGVDGTLYPTSPNFYESLRLLETLIANAKVRTIDASEGGAKIAGTEIATLDETLRTYCANPIDDSSFFSLLRPQRDHSRIHASLIKIADHIERCGLTAQQALEQLYELQGDALPESVQKAREQIEADDILYHELQSALERLRVEINRPAFWDASGNKNGWLPRYQMYFNQIESACAKFAPFFREVAEEMD